MPPFSPTTPASYGEARWIECGPKTRRKSSIRHLGDVEPSFWLGHCGRPRACTCRLCDRGRRFPLSTTWRRNRTGGGRRRVPARHLASTSEVDIRVSGHRDRPNTSPDGGAASGYQRWRRPNGGWGSRRHRRARLDGSTRVSPSFAAGRRVNSTIHFFDRDVEKFASSRARSSRDPSARTAISFFDSRS